MKNLEKIIFSSNDISQCKSFSDKIDTGFYSSRGQFNLEKRKNDVFFGKLGELAVYFYLKDKYDISYPDFNIYKAKEKSWDYDLKSSSFNLHVKTQEFSQSIRFGESWIFQNEDKHVFKNYKENDYVSFVILNIKNNYAIIKAILPIKLLHEKELFKKPVLTKLASKSAVYFSDIVSTTSNIFFLKL